MAQVFTNSDGTCSMVAPNDMSRTWANFTLSVTSSDQERLIALFDQLGVKKLSEKSEGWLAKKVSVIFALESARQVAEMTRAGFAPKATDVDVINFRP
jgi:hypothetical protein